MKQEEKQLLLKDLCARQFYNTKVLGPWEKDGPCELSAIDLTSDRQVRVFEDWYKIEEVKPYLRPMSSMTVEEEYEYHQCKSIDCLDICEMEHEEMLETGALWFSHAIDWLNKKGFDYRGLIPMGLALEAPKDMYEIK